MTRAYEVSEMRNNSYKATTERNNLFKLQLRKCGEKTGHKAQSNINTEDVSQSCEPKLKH